MHFNAPKGEKAYDKRTQSFPLYISNPNPNHQAHYWDKRLHVPKTFSSTVPTTLTFVRGMTNDILRDGIYYRACLFGKRRESLREKLEVLVLRSGALGVGYSCIVYFHALSSVRKVG